MRRSKSVVQYETALESRGEDNDEDNGDAMQ